MYYIKKLPQEPCIASVENNLHEIWTDDSYYADEYIVRKIFNEMITDNDSVEKLYIKLWALNRFYGAGVRHLESLAEAMHDKIPDLDERLRNVPFEPYFDVASLSRNKSNEPAYSDSHDLPYTGGKRQYLDLVDEIAEVLKEEAKKPKQQLYQHLSCYRFSEDLKGFLKGSGLIEKKQSGTDDAQNDPTDSSRSFPRYFCFATKFCSHHDPAGLYFPIYDSFVATLLEYYDDQAGFKAKKKVGFIVNENGKVFEKKSDRTEFLKKARNLASAIDDFRLFYGLERYSFKQIDQFLWWEGNKVLTSKKEEAMK